MSRTSAGAEMNTITPLRIMAQMKLALLGDCGCQDTLGALANEAHMRGLTGAEIDTALAGRSFEARADAALAYACAIKSGEPESRAMARSRAMRLGLSEAELDKVRDAAEQILVEQSE